MSTCHKISNCTYFKNFGATGLPDVVAQAYKKKYCHGVVMECARYSVSRLVGPHAVPDDLGPHERDRAVLLIGAAGA
jgi:hypothetical protein